MNYVREKVKDTPADAPVNPLLCEWQPAMTEGYKPYKKISARSCQLLWRFDKIYWLDIA